MRNRISSLLFLVPFLLFGAVCAGRALSSTVQATSHVFTRLAGEDGLPGSAITGITQDAAGFLWFGTDDGLARYDGCTFRVYRPDPRDPGSISHPQISALYRDRAGNLWVGTIGGGLNRVVAQTGTFQQYQHEADDAASLSDNHVIALHEDDAGRLWVATADGTLHQMNRETGRVVARYQMGDAALKRPGGRPEAVMALDDVPGTGTLRLAVGRSGVVTVDPETGEFTAVPLPIDVFEHGPDVAPASDADDLPGLPPAQTLHVDAAGNLWIGLKRGVLRLDLPSGDVQAYVHQPSNPASLSDDSVNVFYTDSVGRLWFGTNSGVNRFDPESGGFIRYGEPDGPGKHAISAIYEDRSGALWFGTSDGTGLYMFHPDRAGFRLYAHDAAAPANLTHTDITAVLAGSDGTLWVGYRNAGLDRIDTQTGAVAHYDDDHDTTGRLPHNHVSALLEDRSGIVWIGTQGGGLAQFDPATDTFRLFTPDEDRIQRASPPPPADSSDASPDAPAPPHPLSPFISTLFEDRQGVLWIGTTGGGGLYRYDPQTGWLRQFGVLADGSRLSSPDISTIFEDVHGVMWIGTTDGGLNAFDPSTEHVQQYGYSPTMPDSLSNDTVWAIAEDSTGTLWIGTSSGLNAFDRDTGAFRVYRQQDGLPSDVIYGIHQDTVVTERGGPSLWLSTANGLARFDLRSETVQQYDVDDGLQGNTFNAGADDASSDGTLYFGGKQGLTVFSPTDFSRNTHAPAIVITEFRMFNQPIRPGEPYNLPVKRGDSLLYDVEKSPLTNVIEYTDAITLSYREDTLAFQFAALDFTAPQKNRYAYMMEGFDSGWIESGARRIVQYTNLPAGTYRFRVKGSNNDGVWNEAGAAVTLTIQPPFWQTWWFRLLLWGSLAGLAALAYGLRMASVTAQKRKLERLVQQRTQELHEHAVRLEDEIVERARAEQHLRDTHEELKSTFEYLQRTQAELVESEKMAALGQLVAGIAHEINTPLGAIQASVGTIAQGIEDTARHLPMLLEELAPDQRRAFVDLAERGLREKSALTSREERALRRALERYLEGQQVERADEVADTLVDMGIYDDVELFLALLRERPAGRNSLQAAYALSMQRHHSRNIQQAVERASKIMFALKRYAQYDGSGQRVQADVVESIEDVLTLYHNHLKHGIDVVKHYGDVPAIRCYADELHQVWTNLVHNAIQAMHGRGRLEIAVERVPNASGDSIGVTFVDSGHGIPDEIRERIFEPFFTTREAGEGSGLGLDICRKIVEKHQGRIEVESRPGRTAFHVRLPVA